MHLVTCPHCSTRVLPTSADSCPACGQVFAGTGEAAPASPVPAAATPAPLSVPARILLFAVLILVFILMVIFLPSPADLLRHLLGVN
jgi:hypothetical protein